MPTNIEDQIISAFEELLSTHSIDDISVTDIIQSANISRTTFYRHFKDKYDAMNYKFVKASREYTSHFSSIDALPHLIYAIITFAGSNRKYMREMLRYSGQNALSDTIFQTVYDHFVMLIKKEQNVDELPADTIFSIKMYCYGTINLMIEWLNHDLPEIDPNTYCRYLMENIPLSLKKYFNPVDWCI